MVKKVQTGWVGWIYFAAIIMMLNSILSIVAGIAGIYSGNQVFIDGAYAWQFDFQTWGWVQLLLGILVMSASISLFQGRTWGRVYAIFATFVGAFLSLMYIPVYPFWGIVAMVLYILVMYAVVVHGDELEVR